MSLNWNVEIIFRFWKKITRNVLTMLDNISYNNIVLIQENKNKTTEEKYVRVKEGIRNLLNVYISTSFCNIYYVFMEGYYG